MEVLSNPHDGNGCAMGESTHDTMAASPDADGYATPHSLQRKPQRMSDHIIPSNADDASTDPRSVYVQPLIQPQRTTTYTQPAAYTRPAYGRQPAMPQAAAPQTVAPQTFGMPPQAAPRQSRPNSRFSYPKASPQGGMAHGRRIISARSATPSNGSSMGIWNSKAGPADVNSGLPCCSSYQSASYCSSFLSSEYCGAWPL